MDTLIEHKCQNPSCGKVRLLKPNYAKNRKYCSPTCASKHQKETGVRKNNKNNSREKLIELYGVEEGESRHDKFRKTVSDFVKLNPIKNRPNEVSVESRQRMSVAQLKRNREHRLSLAELKLSNDVLKKMRHDQAFGEGSYDKKRQQMKGVFSLDWFKKKYGEDVGLKKYTDRCANIKKTTHFKTYNLTNERNVSKISNQLFDTLYKDANLGLTNNRVYYHKLNHEHACSTNTNFDFVVLDKKKIIEFNGDKFHANPLMYSPDDTPNPFIPELKASQIWMSDKIKTQSVIEKGFDVLIIWESEFKNNRERTINKCKEFLMN